MKVHYKTNSVHNKGRTKEDYPPLTRMAKTLSNTKKKEVVEGTYTPPMEGKTHSDVAKKKNKDAHTDKKHSVDTIALMVKQRNTKEGKENAKKGSSPIF